MQQTNSNKVRVNVFSKKMPINFVLPDQEALTDNNNVVNTIHNNHNGNNESPVANIAERRDKVPVSVRVVFLKIGEIDTAKENFFAEAFIQAKWREPRLDHQTTLDRTAVDCSKYWNPKLYIDNSLGEIKEVIWNSLFFNANGQALICERRKIKGIFMENLELQEFPFDTQDLTLTIISERTTTELILDEDEFEISTINMNSFVDEQEWRLFSYVNIKKAEIGKVLEEAGPILHPSIAFMCRATRRSGYFFWNTFFVLFFINCMTFTTFSVGYHLPQNRIQLTFILLLTTVAFRSNVNNSLPKISYLTMMDMYILASFVIQCLACSWHAVAGTMLVHVPKEKAYWVDMWVLVGLSSSFLFANIIFYIVVRVKVFSKQWQYIQIEKKNKEKTKASLRKQECHDNVMEMSSDEIVLRI